MPDHKLSLKRYNTFNIEAYAHTIKIAETPEDLLNAWRFAESKSLPFLLTGEGSNLLFTDNFNGVVVVNRLKGISVKEQQDCWVLHVGAGENWHRCVEYTLNHDMPGLENLALIPGCAGSAPIQNIGAYGIELNRVCDYVDVLNLRTGDTIRLTEPECQFAYRDSIFKHQYRKGYAIIAVGLKLAKVWQPVLTYGDLVKLDQHSVTPRQVFDAVCAMRISKLPDPRKMGNAGSFFKNPLVSAQLCQNLLLQYPKMPHFLQSEGDFKLAAGWLIDQCDLKGYRVGGASVHSRQALVLVNEQNASGKDVIDLARHIRQTVGNKFDVWLEPEVRFIGEFGEIDAVEMIR